MSTIRVLGAGRAGRSFSLALTSAGHRVLGPLTRADDPLEATSGVDALVLAVPDDELAHVAASIRPSSTCCVIHLSGSLGLDVLAPHPRRASMHPLVPLPTAAVGAARLSAGVTMAIAGDSLAGKLAASLGATLVSVADEDRAAVPRGRLRCRQPRGGAPRPGRADRRDDRAPARGVPRAVARRSRGRASARAEGRADRSRAARRLGDDRPASRRARRRGARRLRRGRRTRARAARPATAPSSRRPPPRSPTPPGSHAGGGHLPRAMARADRGPPRAGCHRRDHAHDGRAARTATPRSSSVPRPTATSRVATIFVNPLQFGDPDGPRARTRATSTADLALAEAAGVRLVLAPAVAEIWPSWPDPDGDDRPRGRPRRGAGGPRTVPAHFDGVAPSSPSCWSPPVVHRVLRREGLPAALRRPPTRRGPRPARRGRRVPDRPRARRPRALEPQRRLSPRAAAAATRPVARARRRAAPRSHGCAASRRAVAAWHDVVADEPLVTLAYAAAVEPATLRAPSAPPRRDLAPAARGRAWSKASASSTTSRRSPGRTVTLDAARRRQRGRGALDRGAPRRRGDEGRRRHQGRALGDHHAVGAGRRRGGPPRRRGLDRPAPRRHAARRGWALRRRRGARARRRGARAGRGAHRARRGLRPRGDRWALQRAREGGHSHARILHAGGAATGAEVERALVAATQGTVSEIREHAVAEELLVEGGACRGLAMRDACGPPRARGGSRSCSPPAARASCSRSRRTRPRPRATASRSRSAQACRSPTSSSCSSTRRRCITRRCRALSFPRRCEGTARSCATPHGERFVDELAPRARREPRDGERDGAGRRLAPVARRDRARRVRLALPDPGGEPRRGRARPRRRTGSRSPPRRTTSRAASATDLDGATAMPGLFAVGEVGLHGGARRQPARVELAARGHGLRRSRRPTRSRPAAAAPRRRARCARSSATARRDARSSTRAVDEVAARAASAGTDVAAARRSLQRAMTQGRGRRSLSAVAPRCARRARAQPGPWRRAASGPARASSSRTSSRAQRRSSRRPPARDESRGCHVREEFEALTRRATRRVRRRPCGV